MFDHVPPHAAMPAKALRRVYAVPDQPSDRLAALMDRLAQGPRQSPTPA